MDKEIIEFNTFQVKENPMVTNITVKENDTTYIQEHKSGVILTTTEPKNFRMLFSIKNQKNMMF